MGSTSLQIIFLWVRVRILRKGILIGGCCDWRLWVRVWGWLLPWRAHGELGLCRSGWPERSRAACLELALWLPVITLGIDHFLFVVVSVILLVNELGFVINLGVRIELGYFLLVMERTKADVLWSGLLWSDSVVATSTWSGDLWRSWMPMECRSVWELVSLVSRAADRQIDVLFGFTLNRYWT